MKNFLNCVRRWSANRVWHARLRANRACSRTLTAGGKRSIGLAVPGFSTDLIRIDFPRDVAERPGWTFAFWLETT